jgi:hypothetical protein
MLRAAIVPMLLAGPTAVMHWPTFSADGWAVTSLRYLVEAIVVTVTLASEPAAGFLPCTTKPPADSEVTLPLAPPNAPLLPLGRGLGLKLGPGEKEPRAPPNPAPAQLPLTGALMVTVVAVTDLLAPALAEGWPATVTQLPTETLLDVAATASVIAVALVKVTVTCPVAGFCTSRLDPDTAAAVPTTPGKAAGRELAAAGLLLATWGAAVVPALPQAVAPSATSPAPARAGVQRRSQFRLAAGARLVVARIMVGSHPRGGSFAA